jgi:hypothetical protein
MLAAPEKLPVFRREPVNRQCSGLVGRPRVDPEPFKYAGVADGRARVISHDIFRLIGVAQRP